MGFDPVVEDMRVYLKCYNAVHAELSTRTAHIVTNLVCHFITFCWIVVRIPVCLRFYQTCYNAVWIELTTRTAHIVTRLIVTISLVGGVGEKSAYLSLSWSLFLRGWVIGGLNLGVLQRGVGWLG